SARTEAPAIPSASGWGGNRRRVYLPRDVIEGCKACIARDKTVRGAGTKSVAVAHAMCAPEPHRARAVLLRALVNSPSRTRRAVAEYLDVRRILIESRVQG